MSQAKRELDAWNNLRLRIENLACEVEAIEYDGDRDAYVSKEDTDAERHAYARLTRMHRLGLIDFPLDEVKDLLEDVLDGARMENYGV
ncbi:hypothetical protein [Bradyrhizobium sp. sBnM-33]|uniref:hypothetical protein n=1 Tax=Bradyrhizobium sp. sBnM-33 TaxID=2831780 RepID=UPI001BCF12FE|nr:hypothetical protein [Bradyrhizobium sp. sBnM-33]WOH52419.1 hypothetical protein RX328_09640 [Bradyrhizobium sp. sBnM-33]